MRTRRIVAEAVLGLALVGVSSAVSAIPFESFDPRSMAMGGSGVAVPDSQVAPLFNPALLVTAVQRAKELTLPAAGMRAYDPDKFRDSVDAFQDGDYVDNLDRAIAEVIVNPDDPYDPAVSTSYYAVADAADSLSAALLSLSDKGIQADGGGALLFGSPGERFGYALHVGAMGTVAGVARYTDDETVAALTDDVRSFAECLEANQLVPGSCDPYTLDLTYVDLTPGPNFGEVLFDPYSDLGSTVDMRGVMLTEAGVSLGWRFDLLGGLALGVTPKVVRADVFNYIADVNTADPEDFNADEWLTSYQDVNMDLGVAKELDGGWTLGLVARNLVPRDYRTVPDPRTGMTESIPLRPMARVGISHRGKWHVVALDADLTSNDPVAYEQSSRFVAFGVELSPAGWLHVRAGYRANTEDSRRDVLSAGLGVSLMALKLDAAVAGNEDEIGASMRIAVAF